MHRKIKLGKYKQNSNEKTSIIWTAYARTDNLVFMISDYILFPFWYNTTTWEKSLLREYLNTKFLNDAFSKEEKLMLVPQSTGSYNDIMNGKTYAKAPMCFFDYTKMVYDRLAADTLGLWENPSYSLNYYIYKAQPRTSDYISVPHLCDVIDLKTINDPYMSIRKEIQSLGITDFCSTGGDYVNSYAGGTSKRLSAIYAKNNTWAVADKMINPSNPQELHSFIVLGNTVHKSDVDSYAMYCTGIRPTICIPKITYDEISFR